MHSHCLILMILTVVMISFNVRSAFILMICIGFYTLSVLINMATCAHKSSELNWVYLLDISIIIFLYFFQTSCGSYRTVSASFCPSYSTPIAAMLSMWSSLRCRDGRVVRTQKYWLEDTLRSSVCYSRPSWCPLFACSVNPKPSSLSLASVP